MVRTRFAPLACNHLSLRELQTGLFNWLFARSKGGKFAVRIGDMDLLRGRTETVHRILDDVRWLEMDWDEGPDVGGEFEPYLQSGRKESFREGLERVSSSDRIYPCFCEARTAANDAPAPYDDPCLGFTSEEIQRRMAGTEAAFVLRYRLDRDKPFRFRDLVRGWVDIEPDRVENPVIRRIDGSPSPFLARVLDDASMKITHILRPESEISRTPAEAALFEEFGKKQPRTGHYPDLIGNDGKAYSRRHGAFTVDSFKKLGYLPRTLANYLVSVGWSRRGMAAKFDVRDLGEQFHLAGVRKKPVSFEFSELNCLSNEYICEEHLDHLADRVLPYLIEGRFLEEEYDRSRLKLILETIRPQLRCLSEIVKYVDIFFGETVIEGRGKEVLKDETSVRVLKIFRDHLEEAEALDQSVFDNVVRRMLEETGLDMERLLVPIRTALTGLTQGADVDRIASILGTRECIGKVDRVLREVSSQVS